MVLMAILTVAVVALLCCVTALAIVGTILLIREMIQEGW